MASSSEPIPVLAKKSLQDPEELAFSPSQMTPRTLNQFDKDESSGVPLQTAWTFWLDKTTKNATAAEYKANLRRIYTVTTVQGFWSVYNHIPSISELPLRSYYHLMRLEREPLWEDPDLSNGGVWRIKCSKRDTDKVWKELLLAAIGEQFLDDLQEGDDICGLSVSPRERDDLIQIWNLTSSAANPDTENDKVMQKVHQLIPDVHFLAEFYKPHQTHSAFEGKRTMKK